MRRSGKASQGRARAERLQENERNDTTKRNDPMKMKQRIEKKQKEKFHEQRWLFWNGME